MATKEYDAARKDAVRMRVRAFDDADDEDAEASTPKMAPARKRKPPRQGAMSSFLLELQEAQAKRAESLSIPRAEETYREHVSGSEVQLDSTNICVQPLPASAMSEHRLGTFFAQWGDVACVSLSKKESSVTASAYAHVAYTSRRDAELALQETNGLVWNDVTLSSSWAPPISLPDGEPAYSARRSRKRRAREQGHYAHAQGGRECSPVPVRHRHTHRSTSPVHISAEFQDAGYASMYSTDSEEVSESDLHRGNGELPMLAARRLQAMLKGLTPRRERIARCMKLALDHADAAPSVADMIARSLLVPTTPLPRKLARLYAMSDILYNTAAPVACAWKYREAFQPWLEAIFLHWGATIRACPLCQTTEETKQQVLAVLTCWDTWLIWPPTLLKHLRDAVEGPETLDHNKTDA